MYESESRHLRAFDWLGRNYHHDNRSRTMKQQPADFDDVTVAFHGGLFEGKEALLGPCDPERLPVVLWVPNYQAAVKSNELFVYDTPQNKSTRYEFASFRDYEYAGVTK
jgi:hypothetical protein